MDVSLQRVNFKVMTDLNLQQPSACLQSETDSLTRRGDFWPLK